MPPKIRDLERQLKRAGFVLQKGQGKGSHRVYKHPNMRGAKVTISGTIQARMPVRIKNPMWQRSLNLFILTKANQTIEAVSMADRSER